MRHLKDPRLSWTNNFSEQMLRMEKLIEGSSLFCAKLEGRFALDIFRSVLQTAVAAQIPVQQYLLDILRTNPKEIEENPENFTPYAYSKRYFAQDNNTETTDAS